MFGDNYDSDILAGMNAGLDTLLVHTGVTTKKLLESYEKKPTCMVTLLKEGQNVFKRLLTSTICMRTSLSLM